MSIAHRNFFDNLYEKDAKWKYFPKEIVKIEESFTEELHKIHRILIYTRPARKSIRIYVHIPCADNTKNEIPAIVFLPSIANYFSVTLDYLMGQDDMEKRRAIKEQINKIADMDDTNEDNLVELIRTCRREKESAEYFENIFSIKPIIKEKRV